MDIPISFRDFKTKENYLTLQNKFSGWDCRKPTGVNNYTKVIEKDFSITYKTINLFTEDDDYQEMFFIKDFLLIKIQHLAKQYILFFKRYIEDKLLLDKEKIKLFSEIQLKKLIELSQAIDNSDFLIKKIKIALKSQLDVTVDYIKDIHLLPNYTIDDKFKMNMNKTDVLLLFLLLRQNNIISYRDSELGLLIEKSFLYQDGDTFKPITKAGKVINEIKHFHRGTDKAVNRLKALFKNDEFYEIDFD